MIITPIKTELVSSGSTNLLSLLDRSVQQLHEKEILVITSKVVSLCEGSVVPIDEAEKEELVIQQSTLYLPKVTGQYGINFTVTDNTFISSAGIDESNGDDVYILWPKDAQQTANEVRHYLTQRFGLQHVGVVICDSTSQIMRRGTVGISLAHSGFASLNDYVGKPDLFNRPFKVSKANVSSGLAAAAVVTMGEGAEQTPLCVISDASFVSFQDRDPSPEELAETTISIQNDLYAPFLQSTPWQQGRQKATP